MMLASCCLMSMLCLMTPSAADIGDPAPALSIRSWVRGPTEPPELAGPHIVCFWATWSQPCRAALRTLAELPAAAADMAVVAVTNDDRAAVDAVLDQVPASIRIGLDDNGRTFDAYLHAHGRRALPHAFVVSADRTISWQGHPNDLASVLTDVLAGTYVAPPPTAPPPPIDLPSELDERAPEAPTPDADPATPDAEPDFESMMLEALGLAYGNAVDAEDWKTAISVLDTMAGHFELDSDESQMLITRKFELLLSAAKDIDGAEAVARAALRERGHQARVMNHIAWTLLAVGDFQSLDDRLPAIAHEAATLAMGASNNESPAIIDTYARSRYLLGQIQSARDWQARAVHLVRQQLIAAGDDEAALAEIHTHLQQLESTQNYYNEVAQLQHDIPALTVR